MELAVASTDMKASAIAIDEQWSQQLTAEEKAATEMVIDLDAEEATCPACMTAFAPGVTHCPECGLRVG